MGKKYLSPTDREIVYRRANACCEYCLSQEAFATHRFSIEHILPQSKGGEHKAHNWALACQGCNNFKYTKTHALDPISQKEVPLYNPRVHDWDHHFIWSKDYERILGLTPMGRASIICMKLNRTSLVNLRRILYLQGEHPPA